tara:strand:- start:5532 stop:6272 length:741 start_codon:yes stop_codon:yes gene_type:complete
LKIPPRKKWGQNFLIDPNIINKIISVLKPEKNDLILEVGPGRGALTKQLSKLGNDINGVEIDPLLCDYLKNLHLKNVKIINESILNFDCKLIKNKYCVIGNLPYNISSPILFKFMEETNWRQLVVMIQKEVAERIVAESNNKKYGRISIMMQTFFNVKIMFHIPNTVFRPIPDVKSSLLSITPKKNNKVNYEKLKLVVENAFKHRRKKIKHNLKKIINEKELIHIKDKRAEQLSVNDFQQLSKLIN